MAENIHRKTVLVDFDEVVHDYVASGGWQGYGHIPGKPKPGAFQFLIALAEEFEVAIFSTRAQQVGGRIAIQNWIKANWPKDLPSCLDENKQLIFHVTAEKLPALVLLDDRALRFVGSFPSVADIHAFATFAEPVRPVEESEGTLSLLAARRGHLELAADSYQNLADELCMYPRVVAQLHEMERLARHLASELGQMIGAEA